MNSFKIVGHGKTRSDETSEYIIEVSPKATVNEVLEVLMSIFFPIMAGVVIGIVIYYTRKSRKNNHGTNRKA